MRFLFSKPKDTSVPENIHYPSTNRLHCQVHSLSETGPLRHHNEDCISSHFLNNQLDELLCVLADGMGGHNAGEVASSMACRVIREYIIHNKSDNVSKILGGALQQAHKEIIQAGNINPEQKGMGTTATVILIKEGGLSFAHIGDSRLYQYRDTSLRQLSYDHTLVNDMYERGEISKGQRDRHPMKNILLQALGTTNIITPQVNEASIPIESTDKYLLCSDGIYDVFSDTELEALMHLHDAAFILECIRCVATDRRASDNFSAILISFSESVLRTTPITKEQNVLS